MSRQDRFPGRAQRSLRSTNQNPNARRLRIEPLEDRRLLASVTVGNLNDVVNGTTTSIAALIATPGADGISLREAVLAANADAVADVIDFAPALTGTIQLTNVGHVGEIVITSSLTINGPGAGLLTIRAFDPTSSQKNGDGSRVFNIDNGNDNTLVDVEIIGLTITGGDSPSGGGAINSHEDVRVADSIISGNTASGDGGAIYGYCGNLTILGTTISNNQARDDGGGINCNFSTTGSLTIRDSTFHQNSAVRRGGAISTFRSTILIENSMMTDNSVAGSSGKGGGLFCGFGTTTIDGTTISGNNALDTFGDGGGIYHSAGVLSITNSLISGNRTATNNNVGGGIFSSYTDISVENSTISGNSTGAGGAGIYLRSSDLLLSDSIVSGNSSLGLFGRGGGVFGKGYIEVVGSTIRDNSATRDGGGIFISQGRLRVEDSTIGNNSAGATGGGIRGGIGDALPGTTTIVNSTVSGNVAGSEGGGVFGVEGTYIDFSTVTANSAPVGSGVASYGPPALTRIRSSIIAGNTSGDVDFVGFQATNSFQSGGYNLIGSGNAVTAFDEPGDQTGIIDPMLGLLADNGGPTLTHSLLVGSPAIDAGDPAAVAGVGTVPEFDQRGAPFGRVSGGRIDIGAFEVQAVPPSADFDNDGDIDGRDFLFWQRGGSPTPLSSGDLALWQEEYGSGLLVASGELLASQELRVESEEPESSAAPWAVSLLTGTRAGGPCCVLYQYVENVDRALEELAASTTLLGKPAVAPFGELVVRRGTAQRIALALFESLS